MSGTALARAKLLGVGQILSSLLSFVLVMVLSRRLVPADLGIYLYFVAVAAAFEGLSDLGLRFKGVVLLAQSVPPGGCGGLMDRLWLLKLALSLVVGVAMLAAYDIGLIAYGGKQILLLTAAVSVTLPSSSPLVWQARSVGAQWAESVVLVAYRLLLVTVAVLLPEDMVDARLMLIALLGGNLTFLLMMLLTRKRWLRDSSGSQAGPVPSLGIIMIGAMPLGVSLLLAQVMPRMWIMWMGLVAGPETVSHFSLAVMVSQSSLIIAVTMSAVYLPVMGRVFRSSRAEAKRIALAVLEFATVSGCIFGVALALGGSTIPVALFGPSYAPAGTYVLMMAMTPPILLFSFIARALLAAAGAGRSDLFGTGTGLTTGLLVGYALHGVWGPYGIVLGYVAGEVVAMTAKLMSVGRIYRLRLRDARRATLATLPVLGFGMVGGLVAQAAALPGWAHLTVAGSVTACIAGLLWWWPGDGRQVLRILAVK